MLSEQSKELIKQRIPNFDSLSQVEKDKETIRIIAKDFYLFCEQNLHIKTKRGELLPFEPNQGQKKLVDAVIKNLIEGKPVRFIVLKARQMGFSTVIEALCYWWTATHRNVTSVIAAHKDDASSNLYRMFQRYYEYSHPYFKPTRKYNTQTDITFDVDDKTKDEYRARGDKPPGLASIIKTTVAKDAGTGRSDTITFLHGSEVAQWKNGDEIVASLMQTVPYLPETFIFLESTAHGVGGYFYDEWQFAKKGESMFEPFFYAWHEHLEYELPSEEITDLDQEEKDLIEIFKECGYEKDSWWRKIAWRRMKKKEFRTNPQLFYQEYPANDIEAFVASGNPVFDVRTLMEMEKHVKEPTCYMLNEKGRKITATETDISPLKVWEQPDPNRKYVIGVDVAEGIEVSADKKEGDFSVIDVMDTKTLKTVARWRGHTDPDLLGEEVFKVGLWYNTALVGVEINNHGLTTVQRLRDRFYRNMYMREKGKDELFEERTSKMGWRTDRKTKPLMIDDLAKAIRDRDIIDYDHIFIRECMTYVRDERGFTNAQEGLHDDCVMAKAIALQLFQWSSFDPGYLKTHKPISKANNRGQTSSLLKTDLVGIPKAKKSSVVKPITRK